MDRVGQRLGLAIPKPVVDAKAADSKAAVLTASPNDPYIPRILKVIIPVPIR